MPKYLLLTLTPEVGYFFGSKVIPPNYFTEGSEVYSEKKFHQFITSFENEHLNMLTPYAITACWKELVESVRQFVERNARSS